MSITFIIIAITVAASFYAWNKPAIRDRWIFNPYIIQQRGQYGRFLTSGFIHADYMHLGFNMFTLYFFGMAIEGVFLQLLGSLGNIFFAGIYLFAIVVSSIPTFLKHRENPNYNALGASGGVSAIVFSYVLLFPLNPIYIFALIPIPGFILGILYIVYSIYQGKRMADNINHDAHLVGAVFGLIATAAIYPASIPKFFQEISTFSLF